MARKAVLVAFADDIVAAMVGLNEAEYDGAAFEDSGIRHLRLEFDDCSIPPDHVASAFLAAADAAFAAGGRVAVHCRAELGRTGTLIALYLMRSCGFTAREAMAWLRIMRPGSVIGRQQHYLCRVEAAGAAAGTADPPAVAVAARQSCGGDEPAVSAAMLAAASAGFADSFPDAAGLGAKDGELLWRLAEEVAEGAERRAAARMASVYW